MDYFGAGDGSGPKKKRTRDRESASPGPTPAKQTKQRKTGDAPPSRKPRRSLTHLKKGEVPKGLKRALELHICLLARIHSQLEVMPQATPEDLENFSLRIRDREAMHAARKGPSLLENKMLAIARELRAKGTSNIARELARIEFSCLESMALHLSRFGVEQVKWDYTASPYSIFNQSMRHIISDSFKHAVGMNAYFFLDVDIPIDNNSNIVNIIDNYVCDYHDKKFKLEDKSPGAVAATVDEREMYRRRDALAEKRGSFLRGDGFPMRVVKLVEDPACNSEDERRTGADNRVQYIVKAKPYRSARMTAFFKWIDEKRLSALLANGQKARGAQERLRVRVPEPEEPKVPTLPGGPTPVDYFDVDMFNDLPTSIRTRYSKPALVALPADDVIVVAARTHEWKTLSDEKFMLAHGNAILENYAIPTAAEMAAATENSQPQSARKKKRIRVPASDDPAELREDFIREMDELDEQEKGREKKGKAKENAKASGSNVRLDDDETDDSMDDSVEL